MMKEPLPYYTSSSPTRRIARNTLMLYFRQMLIMAVSLYTVRVVLNTLGAEDYGIYNVVAGVVTMFGFVNNTMATSTQRFLNFTIGKKDKEKTQQTFNSSVLIHFGIALIFILLAESVGLWFVNSRLNIPPERHPAALWCYQFSVMTTVFNVLRVPYNAMIIAYEKMSFFAGMSIIEASLKLVVVYLLLIATADKLVVYSGLLTFLSIVILLCHKIYYSKKFESSHFHRIRDVALVKELLGFSGWSLLGATANVANQQGTNIVLNIFTNVAVNAAMGIATQVNTAVYSFVGNFQTAFNPQLVKSYAAGETGRFESLVIRSSKFSFFLLSLLVTPLYIHCPYVLGVWLQDVPEYAVSFVRLILLWSLVDSLNGPLWMSIQATGNIRKYQLIVSILIFANLPLSIVALKLNAPPQAILIIRLALAVITTIWRMFFLRGRVGLPVKEFAFNVVARCTSVFVAGFLATAFLSFRLTPDLGGLIVSCLWSLAANLSLMYTLGMTKAERNIIHSFLRSRCRK